MVEVKLIWVGVSGKEDLLRLCRMFIHYDDNAMVGSKVMNYPGIIIKKGIGEGGILKFFH